MNLGASRQELADATAQGTSVDRLGDVAVASGIDSLLFFAFHGERGQSDYRNPASLFVLLEPTRQLQAIDSWQLNVRQDQVGAEAAQQRQCLLAAGRRQDLVALIDQQDPSQLK